MYWQDSVPAELLDTARLVGHVNDLPYQHGRPLAPVEGEGIGDTALVDYSTTHDSSPDRQVYVSIHGDDCILGSQADRYANELLDQISDDELSVNAPQGETQQDKKTIGIGGIIGTMSGGGTPLHGLSALLDLLSTRATYRMSSAQ